MDEWGAIKALRLALKAHLPWQQQRLTLLAQLLLALYQVRTVNLAEVATALNARVKIKSNYTRLQRFFSEFAIDQALIARAVVHWLALPERWVLTLDRTNWKLGRAELNILVLAVVHHDIAIPLFWTVLGKAGNSNTAERVALLERFIATFGVRRIESLLADREFVGAEWVGYLRERFIPFVLRIKADARIETARGPRALVNSFRGLGVGRRRVLRKARRLWGQSVYVAAQRLEGEWLIVISSHRPQQALASYALRWRIESLFAALKSQGFRLEATHLTDPERLSRLLAVLTLATAWAVRTGHWRDRHQPRVQKKPSADPNIRSSATAWTACAGCA